MQEPDDNTPSLSYILAEAARMRSQLDAMYDDENVHAALKGELGEAWGMAVDAFNGEQGAARYLLTPNAKYEGQAPMDALEGHAVTLEYVHDDIGRIAHGIYF